MRPSKQSKSANVNLKGSEWLAFGWVAEDTPLSIGTLYRR
jgi:hypothetical protein